MNWETSKRPLIIAHRGFTKEATENSLEAVEAALRLGCDGVEVDIRMTADGELVVFHDDSLQRLAGRNEWIEKLPLESVREVRLRDQARIPTLTELLDLVRDRMLINLEVKTVRLFSSRLERSLRASLNAFGLQSTILVSSFHPLPLRRLRKLDPTLKRGYLVSQRYLRTRYRPLVEKWTLPFSLNPSLEMTEASFVSRAHEAGRRIFVWTVNREDDIKKMIRLGVDGIFSDRPDLLIKASL